MSAEPMSSVVRPSLVCVVIICEPNDTDYFQSLVVASRGPYARIVFEFVKKTQQKKKKHTHTQTQKQQQHIFHFYDCFFRLR